MAIAALAAHAEPPVITVTHDDTRIDRSCRVIIPPNVVIHDENGDGVIHIVADDITVEFVQGQADLFGAPADLAYELMTGVGIRIDGRRNVTLINPSPRRFKVGLWATNADGLTISGGNFSDGFAMRLGSTPQREDAADWLWPHANDNGEWRTRYGAAVYVEQSRDVTITGITTRRRQNAVILDRVTHSRIYDNDCSFLSGWGLAMWRSSHNTIARNAFDFCIRGYSNAVYNRGQDSAGILIFEQCSDNVFAENSATHGGDGVFGFGGKEALGDGPVPQGFDHTRKGCNDNLFVRNDLSYAAAHGLELTFSFGNRIWHNTFVENAICGIWAGYSQNTEISSNDFRANGDAGYGLERGGINIEHGAGNRITANTFELDAVALHLWTDPDEAIRRLPWALANYRGSTDNLFAHNAISSVPIAVRLRGENTDLRMGLNLFTDVGVEVEGEWHKDPAARLDFPRPLVFNSMALPGVTSPIGQRRAYAGRRHIIMGEYFPWDFQAPLLRFARAQGALHTYELFGVNHHPDIAVTVQGLGIREHTLERPPAGAPVHVPALLTIRANPGLCTYDFDLHLTNPDESTTILSRQGSILAVEWQVKVFAWNTDPRHDPAAWRREGLEAPTPWQTVPALNFEYAHRGPAHFGLTPDVGVDRFGTLARARIPLPAGSWLFRVRSDDGVRVTVDDRVVVENWTWHAPREDRGELHLDTAREVEVFVEHFELDGYSALRVDIEPLRR
ncbi:MAG: right-handed parallel beta-helix repeat-containing protein [Phycisphaeraceae bacterium]|nr:right-handed parallel beta-helix repeat-containing protein [Phycisphaeraceae bacterium]